MGFVPTPPGVGLGNNRRGLLSGLGVKLPIVGEMSFGPGQQWQENEARRNRFMDWVWPWRHLHQAAIENEPWRAALYKPIMDRASQMVRTGEYSHEAGWSWATSVTPRLEEIRNLAAQPGATAGTRPLYAQPTTGPGFAIPSGDVMAPGPTVSPADDSALPMIGAGLLALKFLS
jgi:hypothetical protein